MLVGLMVGKGSDSEPDPSSGHSLTKTFDGRQLAPEGTLEFPNTVGHKGDPLEAVKDFKRIYAALIAFRKVHSRLPNLGELLDVSKPLVKGVQLSREDLQNPDWQYSEDPMALAGKKQPSCPYAINFAAKRPDGTPKPAFPRKGELDVWLFSNLTARSNTRLYPDGTRERHYSGVHVVLFSDGSIRQFKHEDLFYVENSDLPGPSIAYPGMTGYKGKKWAFAEARWNKPSAKLRVTYGN